jgi:adenosylcobinamide kinase/adenosylcobinamide-phosphate guanylyltransferase
MGRLTLILGGARSGKSALAERLATDAGERVLYIATGEASDDEMRARIRLHQMRRPRTWTTVEAPLDPSAALEQVGANWDAVLLDSAAIWLSNQILRSLPSDATPTSEAISLAEVEISRNIEQLRCRIHEHPAACIVVSDEAGLGIVPSSALGRNFRDLLGTMNQLFAADASEVLLVVAGLPLQLKTRKGDQEAGMAGAT